MCLPSFASETQCQLTNVTESIDQSVPSVFSSENPWKQEDVASLSEQSNTPLSSSETPWKLEYDTPLVNRSHAPEHPSNQSANQSSSPWSPNESQWKLENVVPSFDQLYRTFSDIEAVSPQRYHPLNSTSQIFRGSLCALPFSNGERLNESKKPENERPRKIAVCWLVSGAPS